MHLLAAALNALAGRWAPIGMVDRPPRPLTLYDGLLTALGCGPRATTAAYSEDGALRARFREARRGIETAVGQPLEAWSNASGRTWADIVAALDQARETAQVQVPELAPVLRPWCDPTRRSTCRIPQVVWGAAAVPACTAPDVSTADTFSRIGLDAVLDLWSQMELIDPHIQAAPVPDEALQLRDGLAELADQVSRSIVRDGDATGLSLTYGSPNRCSHFLLAVASAHPTLPSSGLADELKSVVTSSNSQ